MLFPSTFEFPAAFHQLLTVAKKSSLSSLFSHCYQTCLFVYKQKLDPGVFQAFLITKLVQICTNWIQIRRLFAEGVLILTNLASIDS
jgi:hypothetical protein